MEFKASAALVRMILPETMTLNVPDGLVVKAGDPEIDVLEDGKPRRISSPDAFHHLGLAWEDVRFVSCTYLRDLPNGPSIPEDAGPPPEPGGATVPAHLVRAHVLATRRQVCSATRLLRMNSF